MPLITVKAGGSVPAGTYPATLVGIAPKRMVTSFSKNGEEQDFLEWTWLVEGPTDDAEIRSLTSTATGPKSRIFEYLVAMLGGDNVKIDASFEEGDLVGKKVQVSIVITDDGYSKIDRVIAPQTTRRRAAAATATPATPLSPESPRTSGDPGDSGVPIDPIVAAAEAEIATEDDLPF